MSKRDKQPPPIVRKTARGLSPVAQFYAEELMRDPIGTEYDLVKRSKRSNPQNALYWKTLSMVVRATGKWPTPEHLHNELKLACGYKMTVVDWETGKTSIAVDSTAFEAMSGDAFKAYMTMAIEKLNEHLGYDVLEFMDGDGK